MKSFLNRRMLVVLLHGLSAGIPLGLTGALLQAWMAFENVDLTTIGLFSLVGIPYTLKFIWSPLMDRYVPPFLGRRRGWIVIAQVSLFFAIIALGMTNPAQSAFHTALFAFLVAFFSATQDIAIDAYRIDVLKPEEYGLGASLYVAGYRVGMPILSISLGLYLSSFLPWNTVYLIMACFMGVGVLATLIGPEPEIPVKHPENLKDAILLPFVEFFKRRGALEILAFVVIYRLTDTIGTALLTAFMVDTGFDKIEIASVKSYLWIPLILGGLLGGATMVRIGLYRSLWVFGILSAASNLMYMALAIAGKDMTLLNAALIVDYVCNGAATSAFSAFMMGAVNKQFTATQFALLTSFMAQARVYLSAPAGWFAKNLGWESYYVVSTLLAIPALLMLFRFKTWTLGVDPKSTLGTADID